MAVSMRFYGRTGHRIIWNTRYQSLIEERNALPTGAFETTLSATEIEDMNGAAGATYPILQELAEELGLAEPVWCRPVR